MTTTPLPPLPHITEDPFRYYTADQMQAYATAARADLEAEVQRLRATLKDVGLFLHHCWCDVQMNEYSFDLLNKQMAAVDAALESKT